MKVTYSFGVKGFRGNVEGMIFYIDRKSGATLGRRMFTFENHPHHPNFRSAQRQIYAIQPSEGYISNLKSYNIFYNSLPENHHKPMKTWTNLYTRLMFLMQKAIPETVDLKTITREQIYEQNLPCKSVKDAIDSGLLPKPIDYQHLNNDI